MVGVSVFVLVLVGVVDAVRVGPFVLVGFGVLVPAGLGVYVSIMLPTSSIEHPGHPGTTPGLPPAAPFSISGEAPS